MNSKYETRARRFAGNQWGPPLNLRNSHIPNRALFLGRAVLEFVSHVHGRNVIFLKDVAAQILVLNEVFEPLLNVVGIDVYFVLGNLRGTE